MSKTLVQPALDVFRVLQKHFPIKRSPMRLRLTVPVCEMEPGLFRECDSLVRNMQGRLKILAVSVHAEGDTSMDHYDEHDDMVLQTNKPLLPTESETDPVVELSKKNAEARDGYRYRRRRKRNQPKTRKLLPLTAEECVPEIDIDDSKADLKDYSFEIYRFLILVPSLLDLSPAQLSSLLKSWERLTAEFSEINDKVMELHPFMRTVEAAGQRPGIPTSPKYTLAQEHADVINLHDWYQSFKRILSPRNSKAKTTSKSKKQKDRCEEPEPPAEASIQYPFSVFASSFETMLTNSYS
ncbi:Ribosome maturation protein Sdo1/SBDS protein [Raphanus sativus]|nr:Ribosome maturation protein Sdo1/SBDS protein [Raphanus sativus]